VSDTADPPVRAMCLPDYQAIMAEPGPAEPSAADLELVSASIENGSHQAQIATPRSTGNR
jgi:hypothetical protein